RPRSRHHGAAMMANPRTRLLSFVLAMTALASSCAMHGLSFRPDHRVGFVSPADGGLVTLPFDVVWASKRFNGTFALFFDSAPMKPNKDLLSLVPRDDPCRHRPVCPDSRWL